MKIVDALRNATTRFRDAGISDAGRDASVLLTHIFSGDREIQYREPEKQLTEKQYSQFQAYVDRRCKREPVSYILEVREFWSLDFTVSEHVLDPRPDSETLIEAVLKHALNYGEPNRILDLGTGSGCLLLTLLTELKNATGVGVDISEEALAVAKKNADQLDLSDRSQFMKSSWFSGVSGQFDLILSNPPYIDTSDIEGLQPEVRNFEPLQALDGGPDGLDCYRSIISDIAPYLTQGGAAIFEVGIDQAGDVLALLEEQAFTSLQVHTDLASVGRCVSGILEK